MSHFANSHMATPQNLWRASISLNNTSTSKKPRSIVNTQHMHLLQRCHWLAIGLIQAFSNFATEYPGITSECCKSGGRTHKSTPHVSAQLSMIRAPGDLNTKTRNLNTYSSDPQTTCQQRGKTDFKYVFSLSNKGWKVSTQAQPTYMLTLITYPNPLSSA